MARPIDHADDYYIVPAGKLVNAVTWLEMRPPWRDIDAAPLRLVPVGASDTELYRALFRTIGTPWLWSRAYAGPDQNHGTPPPDAHFALQDGRRVGIVEFDGRGGTAVEIAWFGLLPDATGRGLGRAMMVGALRLARASAPERVWLHTCNFDHPAALGFYKACGFSPYATGFEIMDDPRLDGRLPRSAAGHVPLIAPSAVP